MIWELFESNFHHSSDDVAIVTSSDSFTWRHIHTLTNDVYNQFAALEGKRVGVRFTADANGLGAVAALERLAANAFLLDANLPDEQVEDIAANFQLHAAVDSNDGQLSIQHFSSDQETNQDPIVTILTSGTTGKPKAVRHTWQSLSGPVRRSDANARWILTFRPHLYAGLQVMLQALMNGAPLVVSNYDATPDDIVHLMEKNDVGFVSSTPSFWRRMFLSVSPSQIKRLPLQQITLGGEIVDQVLLSQLQECFPQARLIHIYATTELGRCFSVSDGLAGFPISYLTKGPTGIELKVVENELWVRSKNSMAGYDHLSGVQAPSVEADWYATGDLVKIESERVLFQGRDSDMINVGGNKVNPLLVEAVVRELPAIADVRIYGISSSIAGQVVACDVVLSDELNPGEAESQIRARCTEKLDRFHVPRIIKAVAAIEQNSAGKTKRSGA